MIEVIRHAPQDVLDAEPANLGAHVSGNGVTKAHVSDHDVDCTARRVIGQTIGPHPSDRLHAWIVSRNVLRQSRGIRGETTASYEWNCVSR